MATQKKKKILLHICLVLDFFLELFGFILLTSRLPDKGYSNNVSLHTVCDSKEEKKCCNTGHLYRNVFIFAASVL
jgi:hypothetical protein